MLSNRVKINLSTSICLVLICKTWLDDKYVAPILSQKRHVLVWVTPSYPRRDCTQIISAVASVNALYSTYVLDLDIVACFLALHEIRLGPRNTANPPADLLSSELHGQSTSEKHNLPRCRRRSPNFNTKFNGIWGTARSFWQLSCELWLGNIAISKHCSHKIKY